MESYFIKQDLNKTSFGKNGVPMLLGRLDIELTERCNNNCIHCCINLPVDDKNALSREMPTEKIKQILREAADLGCMSVRFTGGEPLLREDFKELYVFAKKLGLKVLLFTNATLITPDLIELFLHIPPREKIEVTVYGMQRSSYEAITRTPGSFAAAWKGIKLLLKNKIPFIVKGVITKYNKEEVDRFEKWALTIPGMDSRPPSYSIFFDFRCHPDKQKNELIRKLRPTPEEGIKILTRHKDEYIREMKEFCFKFMRPAGKNLFSCGSGVGGGCVDAYGTFQPCLMLKHPDVVCDLSKGNLKGALENFFPQIRQIQAKNIEYLNRCGKCFLRGLCEQCPAKSWAEHGTLDTPVEYLCAVAHAQARFLGLLKNSEMAWEVENWKERISQFVN